MDGFEQMGLWGFDIESNMGREKKDRDYYSSLLLSLVPLPARA